MFGRRILVLIPHPDDEVVGCCAAIGRAREAGSEVFALYVTTGVPQPPAPWRWRYPARVRRRREEAKRAAALLGIAPVAFHDVPGRTLKAHLAEARDSVIATMADCGADAVWVPAYEGGHQDHDAANALGWALGDRVAVCEFAEYNFAGGAVRSQAFPETLGAEHEIRLTAQEAELKRKALTIYGSEKGNLSHVEAARECLRPLATYDYTRPPHEGRLFYERFHWVPFRHPRIDFTRPSDVCAVLGAFQRGPPEGPPAKPAVELP